VYISDPAARKLTYTREEFCHCWISTKDDGKDVGIALLLEPSPGFYEQEGEKINRKGFLFLFSYLRPYKNMVIQLFLGLLFGSLLQLILPFLTQSIVDFGISAQNIGYIYLVLIAQLVLTFSSSAVGFIRGWILLHLGTRINIALISDFLIKMMRLPMGYFDTKMTGDILQRINDHTRIQNYLTNSSLSILFSVFNLFIFSIVLLPKVSQEFKLNITGGLNFGQFINFLYFKDLTLHDLKKVKQQFLGHSLV
jgi:ATP-binding cassette subfamily B protein